MPEPLFTNSFRMPANKSFLDLDFRVLVVFERSDGNLCTRIRSRWNYITLIGCASSGISTKCSFLRVPSAQLMLQMLDACTTKIVIYSGTDESPLETGITLGLVKIYSRISFSGCSISSFVRRCCEKNRCAIYAQSGLLYCSWFVCEDDCLLLISTRCHVTHLTNGHTRTWWNRHASQW